MLSRPVNVNRGIIFRDTSNSSESSPLSSGTHHNLSHHCHPHSLFLHRISISLVYMNLRGCNPQWEQRAECSRRGCTETDPRCILCVMIINCYILKPHFQ